jgi:uncharacterized protein YqeY
MMSKREELTETLKTAMKARDEITVATVRLVIAKMKEADINARGAGKPDGVGDAELMSVMQGMIKQRQESAEIYAKNGRPELAAQENGEIEVIRRFLPKQMDDVEVRKIIDTLIAELGVKDVKDMGKLMGALKTKYAGQMDMAKASGMVKERIAAAKLRYPGPVPEGIVLRTRRPCPCPDC